MSRGARRPGAPSGPGPRGPQQPAVPPHLRAAIDHLRAGRLEQAEQVLRMHLRREPEDANAQFLLGNILSQQHKDEPAIYALERAAALKPGDPQRWLALGVALLRGRGAGAAEAVIAGCPAAKAGDLDVLTFLADVLAKTGRAGEGAAMLEGVLARRPEHAQALKTLGALLAMAGRTEEAVELFRRAAADGSIQSVATYCFQTNYSGTMPAREVFGAHRLLHELVSKRAPRTPPAARRELREGEPLRVVFLSADLQQHSISYFLEPILEHLDRSAFRCICASAGAAADEVTARLRSKADEWVDASSPDANVATEAIRRARPDILIDLGGLTGAAPVMVLARRLAPVQATYLGYPNTSGVPNVDWRLVDESTDPSTPSEDGSRADDLATEKLLRIEGCFVCYRPPDDAPPVAQRPEGPIVFGSFNTSPKISARCVALWAGVLRAVPSSVLALKRRELSDPWIADQFRAAFAREGVDASRLRFLGKTPTIAEHLDAYRGVDIALDTFPYHGTTTTCEAMWMGAPVVSLAGRSHASRVGLSLLHAAGLPENALATPEAFVERCAQIAADRPTLARLRATLRDRLRRSTLCDGPGFATRLGAAIRHAWAAPASA